MTVKNLLPLLGLIALSLFSCNPDCDSLIGLRPVSDIALDGGEFMLTASPISSLENRKVFINDIPCPTRFIKDEGLVVSFPDGHSFEGTADVRVEDPDCLDFISLDLDVVDNTFFLNNPDYIFPVIPEIIIPTIPQDFPPSIENAWLHPENLDYCIWFTLLKDVSINSMGDTITNCRRVFDSSNSFEQSTCYKNSPDHNMYYKLNPLSGYIDENNNIIMTIHRPTGEEEFHGRMVHLDEVPEKYRQWSFIVPPDCSPGLPPDSSGPIEGRNHMMILTSLKNGKQMLIYQQGIDKVLSECEE